VIVTLLVIVGSATLIGAVLLTLGLRGRRIDDHPVCARCRFDLSGAPEPRTTCPECGRNVSEPKGIKIGQRRRRPRMLATGAAALTMSLLIWGVAGWGLWKGTNWNTYKPTGWLLFEARVGAPGEADAAIREVATRLAMGIRLSPAQLDEFTRVVLDHQADFSRPWGDGWGNAVDMLVDMELLSPEELAQLQRNLFWFELETRPIVRSGEPVYTRLRVLARNGSSLMRYVLIDSTRTLIDGVEAKVGGGRAMLSGRGTLSDTVTMTLEPGQHNVEVEWRWAVVNGPMDTPNEEEWRSTEHRAETLIIAADADDGVGLLADESAREAIRRAIKLPKLEALPRGGDVSLQVGVTLDRPPKDLAFDVFVRQGDQEWKAGALTGLAGHSVASGFGPSIQGLQPGAVTVIFRSNEAVLRRTIDMTTAWDGELIFENVPVLWPPAQPASPPE